MRQKRDLPEPPSPSAPSLAGIHEAHHSFARHGIKHGITWKDFHPRKDYLILFLAITLLIILSITRIPQPTGAAYYYDYGYGGGGFIGLGSFSDIYYSYGYIIDTVIFLIIFLGIGRGLFKKHFGEGGTSVYTGIGLFLAFALLLWEERTGIHLLEEFGGFVLVFFVIILTVGVYKWLKMAGASTPWSIALMIIGFLFILFFMKVSGTVVYRYIMDFLCTYMRPVCQFIEEIFTFSEQVNTWQGILLIGGIIVFALFMFRRIFRKAKQSTP